jgi:hypothetical protein
VHAQVAIRILLSSSVSVPTFVINSKLHALLPGGRRPFRLPHIIHEHADARLAARPTRISERESRGFQRLSVTLVRARATLARERGRLLVDKPSMRSRSPSPRDRTSQLVARERLDR